MRLDELKNLNVFIIEMLKKYPMQGEDLEVTEEALLKRFNVNRLSALPKTVQAAYTTYKESFFKLQLLSEEIENSIRKHELAGIRDNDKVNWDYFPRKVNSENMNPEDAKMAEIIRSYELLMRQHVDFNLACQNVEKNQNSQGKVAFERNNQRTVNFAPDDFSDKFVASLYEPLQDLLESLSGDFDYDEVNQQLSSLRLATLDEKLLPTNYGKDSYTTYFDNQSTHLPLRTTNTPAQNKKAKDFVNEYLEKSGFPGTITPNLKVLITTLTNQGMLGQAVWNIFANFFSIQGLRILNFGHDFRIHISFDKENQLKVKALMNQDSYKLPNAETIENIGSIIKMEFTIGVNVVNDVPHFSLKDQSVACSFITPLEYPMVVSRDALRNSKSITANNLNPLTTCIEYIAKYLGYNSLENFYVAKGGFLGGLLSTVADRERFGAAEFPDLLELANKYDVGDKQYSLGRRPVGKKLSPEEYKFFQDIYNRYTKYPPSPNGNINPAQISTEICKFVSNRLQLKLSNAEKLSYVWWLQLARELKGSENLKDEIHDIYEALVKKFADSAPGLLIEVSQNDPELYQEIVSPSSFFTTKLQIPNYFHAKMLAKYPSILRGEESAKFVEILNKLNLSPQDKLQFLVEFIKNDGDIAHLNKIAKNFFDKNFINYLLTAVQSNDSKVVQAFGDLVKRQPAAVVCDLREGPLAKVFEVYCREYILNQQARSLLSFLEELDDKKIFTRFGPEFLGKFVAKIKGFAFSQNPEDFKVVPAITSRLTKLLDTEADKLVGDFGDNIFLGVNLSSDEANDKLRAMQKKKATSDLLQPEEILTTEDKELASLIAKQEKSRGLKQALEEVKSSVQQEKKLEQKSEHLEKGKPVVSIEKSSVEKKRI